MLMKRITYIVLLLAALMSSCSRGGADVQDPKPSVYYWRTVFSLDSTEQQFLAQHHVGRIYMRYFDVALLRGNVMPNATISFDQPVPQDIEIIPTVFIVENCLHADINGVAKKLVNRILKMNKVHNINNVKEIQIDCDWTKNSQERYFNFLNEVRQLLTPLGMRLSATIRLHQLIMKAPPVDYGVLMMYNTGAIDATNGHNPILDFRDVYPYLKNLRNYSLPLCAAWPAYKWNLLKTGNQFKAILYDVNLADTSLYREVAPGHIVVVANRILPEPNSDGADLTRVLLGDSVITVMPTDSQILDIISATEKERPGINKQAIIYSLDTKNINNYNTQFYEKVFNR